MSGNLKMLVVALVAATVLCNAAAEAQVSYRAYVIRPVINNDPILEGEALPVQCRDETAMKVMCARGEYEPASFLVQTDEPLKQVMVEVGPLKGKTGVLPPQAVDVRIAQKVFVDVTWTAETYPWLLVHDPGMIKVTDRMPRFYQEIDEETVGGKSVEEYKAGHSRRNELVKDLIDTDTLQPGDVAGFRQYWLTVRVPDDAQAGTYRGVVAITAANAEPTELMLEVTVPSFDLLPPAFEYCIYYPTMLEQLNMSDSERDKYHPLTERQYLAELRNMAAHGCLNPNIYAAPEQDEAGNIHFTHLDRILGLREQVGMPKDVMLYISNGAGMAIKPGPLTEQERRRNIVVAEAAVAWAKSRGYLGAMFMGAAEAPGGDWRTMRENYESVRAGGSGIWGGNFLHDSVETMADVVDRLAVIHPGAITVGQMQWQVLARDFLMHRTGLATWDPALCLTPAFQNAIKLAHAHGHKIFGYWDPQGGMPVPEMHRRHRGMALWKIGLDGTMPWGYVSNWTPAARLDNPHIQDNGLGWKFINQTSLVIRGPEGVLDTLAWKHTARVTTTHVTWQRCGTPSPARPPLENTPNSSPAPSAGSTTLAFTPTSMTGAPRWRGGPRRCCNHDVRYADRFRNQRASARSIETVRPTKRLNLTIWRLQPARVRSDRSETVN